jgi:hypothetical protein
MGTKCPDASERAKAMNQDKWKNLNDRLKLVADVSENFSNYASEELERIRTAAGTVSGKLIGHCIETVVTVSPENHKIWESIQVRLRRKVDDYFFPRTITIELNKKGQIGFELPWTPMEPYTAVFITKKSGAQWESLFASLVEVNLIDRSA